MNSSPSRLRLAHSSSTLNSNHTSSRVPPILASSVFYNPVPSYSSKRRTSNRRRDRMLMSSSSSISGHASNAAGCCTATSNPTADWMNWVEQSIDFFGCEAQNDGFLGKALALAKKEFEFIPRNYCQLHEDFFEALLKEQLLENDYAQEFDYSSTGMSDTSYDSGRTSLDSIPNDEDPTISSSLNSNNKKQRIPYFHKLSPRRSKRIAPIEAYNQQYNPALLEEQTTQNSKNDFKLEDLIYKDLPEPHTLVHAHVQMQKDKGKGLPLGSAVCAEGRDMTLHKLREKMKLVLQVSGEDRKSSIKKRPAKISNESPTFVETRSMIELNLGFLSLNYGLLLKWDCRTGKVVFVCLRKMCHETFYKKLAICKPRTVSAAALHVQKSDLELPPFVVVSKIRTEQRHALYQRTAGTEVVLVDAPYRVPQDEFGPSMITLQILEVTGISLKKKWSISVTFAGHSEWVRLDKDSASSSSLKQRTSLVPKRPSMIWQVPDMEDESLHLEIALYETPKRKKHKLVASMTLPLASLIAQPTSSKTKSWSLTMPLQKTGKLTLNLQHRSDYTHWLYRELDKRRLEEVAYYKKLEQEQNDYKHMQQQQLHNQQQEQEGEPEFYDWLCGICLQ